MIVLVLRCYFGVRISEIKNFNLVINLLIILGIFKFGSLLEFSGSFLK